MSQKTKKLSQSTLFKDVLAMVDVYAVLMDEKTVHFVPKWILAERAKTAKGRTRSHATIIKSLTVEIEIEDFKVYGPKESVRLMLTDFQVNRLSEILSAVTIMASKLYSDYADGTLYVYLERLRKERGLPIRLV